MVSLEVRDLGCIRDDRILFSKVNIDLYPGQLLLVEGDNGSGKTSLLRILCGIRLPEHGHVIWQRTNNDKKTAVSVHGQESYAGDMAFLGHLDGNKLDLTVTENLEFSCSLALGNSSTIKEVLERVGLSYFDDLQVSNLSAGQRRRLALARLLLSGARLWILDEPFTALDKKGIAMVEREINAQLDQGGLVIMTSHHSVSFDSDKVTKLSLSQ
ncbi:MAG: cytochrome c biogenesis heme-transporting ATPase CcmA [Gammaproteobacteria bacterium]|nr:cytochrome c biogenesis heme-transporting ATPase CcmA [Gammaproteobacteria bacterium]